MIRSKEKISSYILDKQDLNFQYKEINKIVNTLNKSKDDEKSNIKPSEHLNKIAVLSDTHGSLISLIGSLLDAGIITKLKQPEFVYDLLNNKYINIEKINETTDGTAKLYYNNDTSSLTKDEQDNQHPLSRFIVIPSFEINENYKGQVIHLGNILDRGRENYHSLLFLKKLKQELIGLDKLNNNNKDNPDNNNKKNNSKYSDKLILLCGNHEILNRVSDDILTRLSMHDSPYIYARDNIVKDMIDSKEMNLIYNYKTKTDNNNRVIFSHAFDVSDAFDGFNNKENFIEKFIRYIKDLTDSISSPLNGYRRDEKKYIIDNLNLLLEKSKLFLEYYYKKNKDLKPLIDTLKSFKRLRNECKERKLKIYTKCKSLSAPPSSKKLELIEMYKHYYNLYKDKQSELLIELCKEYYKLNFKLLQILDPSIAFGIRMKVNTPFNYRNMWGLPSKSSLLNIVGHKPNTCFKYEDNLIHVDVSRNTNYCNNNEKYGGKISTLYLDDNIINEIIKYKREEKYENINNLLSKNSNTIDYTVERDKTNNKYNEILVNNKCSVYELLETKYKLTKFFEEEMQPHSKKENRTSISKLPKTSSRSKSINRKKFEFKPTFKHDRLNIEYKGHHYMKPIESTVYRNKITREYLDKRQQENNQNKLQRN